MPGATQPAPGAYHVSDHQAIARVQSPHTVNSAAFASSSGRFPKTRVANGDSYLGPNYGHSVSSETRNGNNGLQRSASFASSSKRLKEHKTAAPGPGAYTPKATSAYSPHYASGPSAAYASGSARNLPYERPSSAAPPPTFYNPSPSERFRGRGAGPNSDAKSGVPGKAAASMRLTSPRFADGHYSRPKNDLPGPGTYHAEAFDPRSLSSATAGRRLPLSTSERKVFDMADRAPGAGHYNPAGSMRGMGQIAGRSDEFVPSAAFRSGSSRLKAQQTLSPGPGGYTPSDGLATASRASAHQPIRRSASFGSSSQRFRNRPNDAPGPGAYHQAPPYRRGHASYRSGSVDDSMIMRSTAEGSILRSPRRAVGTNSAHLNVSASFASGSERTQLPANRTAREVPGPGTYPNANPIADYARPLRRSASFSSSSSRLKGPPKSATSTPPPGAYDPLPSSRGRVAVSASSRYSMYGDTRVASARGRNYRSNLG